jgi:nucleoside-diphosphate-sugar epimerase
MAPIKVFITGVTGYIGSTTIDLLLNKETTAGRFALRALVRNKEKAEKDIRPLGIEPLIGDLDDLQLLETEAANADVVLSFADADHLPSIEAILRGLSHRPRSENGRRRPIFIHTSGTGVLLDQAHGRVASTNIYYDNDVAQLNTLAPTQPHRHVDLKLIDPRLKGVVDTYIVAPPTIWGFGTGPGNHNSIQIPFQVATSIKHQQASQIGEGKNIWSKVHVVDLAHFYILLLERALKEPEHEAEKDSKRVPLPKNEDAYYFAQAGDDFSYGSVAQEIANVFVRLGINDSGKVTSVPDDEEDAYWEYWPSGAASLVGGNSRSRAVKGREILGWEAKYEDFNGYIFEEIQRQRKVLEKTEH